MEPQKSPSNDGSAGAGQDDVLADLDALEQSARSRQRRAAITSVALLLCVTLAVYLTAQRVSAKQHELDALKQKIADAQEERRALEDANRELNRLKLQLDEDIAQRRREVAQLQADKAELSEYSGKIRAILEQRKGSGQGESAVLNETGTVPAALRNGVKSRVSVGGRRGSDGGPAFSVELWLEVPSTSEALIESVTYDLDPRFYERRHFVSRTAPSSHIMFTVRRCESKVLTSLVLRNGAGAFDLDFDWCKTSEWHDAVLLQH